MSCYGMAIYNACQCWPFVICELKPQNIPLCLENVTSYANETIPYKVPLYKQCLVGRFPYAIEECLQNCLPDCDYQQVVFFNDDTSYYFGDQNATVLTVTVADFVYPLFVEYLIEDWQTILNAFGGNIGLWLGGSLLAIIHLPVFLVKILLGIIVKIKKRQFGTSDMGIQTTSSTQPKIPQ